MQALNTSGLLELMENLGATGECEVDISYSYSYLTIWSNLLDRNLKVHLRDPCRVDCPTIARSRTNCLQWTRSCGWCTSRGKSTLKNLLWISHASFSSNPMEIKGDTVSALGSEKLQLATSLPKLSFLPQCFFDKVNKLHCPFRQGCRSHLTSSNSELTQDHVLQARMIWFFQPSR